MSKSRRPRIALVAILAASFVTLQGNAEARSRESSLRKTARAVAQALLRGDRKAFRSLTLSRPELMTMVTRIPPKKRYNSMLKKWFDKRFGEFAEAKNRGSRIDVGACRIRDVTIISQSKKVLRPVIFAIVSVELLLGKKTGDLKLYFVVSGARWRLSIKR